MWELSFEIRLKAFIKYKNKSLNLEISVLSIAFDKSPSLLNLEKISLIALTF